MGRVGPSRAGGPQQHPYLLAGASPAPPAPLGGGGAAAAGGSSILPPALSVAAATAAAAAIFPTLRLCVRRARPATGREERREVRRGGGAREGALRQLRHLLRHFPAPFSCSRLCHTSRERSVAWRGRGVARAGHGVVQRSTAWHSTAQHNSMVQHSSAQHGTAQHSTAQHSMA